VIEPLGYLDFAALMADAAVVITDSGGVQEETTVLGVPCLTVRPNTERPITITHGTNRLVEPKDIVRSIGQIRASGIPAAAWPPPLWDGQAGERAATILASWVAER
jgi:UDP-N-acetylglucosamine 2-epimerase (non-hydrolysing)